MNEPINKWPKSNRELRREAKRRSLYSRLFNFLGRHIMAGETTIEQQVANTEALVTALPQTLATAISTAIAALPPAPAPVVDLSSLTTALTALKASVDQLVANTSVPQPAPPAPQPGQ